MQAEILLWLFLRDCWSRVKGMKGTALAGDSEIRGGVATCGTAKEGRRSGWCGGRL
jgi:hypothetical protein